MSLQEVVDGQRDWWVETADVEAGLALLPDESAQCVVTSPPYYRQRDYGVAGQIGLETTLDAYVERLVAVFRAVRRVLRRDGVLWVNIDDGYVTNPGNGRGGESVDGSTPHRSGLDKTGATGLRPKNLMGAPWRLALALQADGWLLRLDGIWHKPNTLPEPARDRPGRDHEYVFLFSRSARYHYDADAVRVPTGSEAKPDAYAAGYGTNAGADADRLGRGYRKRSKTLTHPLGRGLRSVWSIPTQAARTTHFAAFPEALAARCVLAGSRVGDVVLDPFSGSGTVAAVAVAHGRRAIGIELSPAYAAASRERILTKVGVRPDLAAEVQGMAQLRLTGVA